jgi:branched-chain amino acid transport system ATP-binding protein
MQEGLVCRGLRCGYGKTTIVREFDLQVSPGEVLGLLGPNGAGKTTLMMTLAGLLPALDGEVRINGELLPNGRPRAAAKKGLALVPDDRSLFVPLTVRENLEVARKRSSPSAKSMIELFPALGERWGVTAGNLSGGEQQMLALARALIQEPKVLLIDEMSMGLAPVTVEALLPVVRRIADDSGTVVVLVEQHVHLALEVADRAVILVHGEIRLSGNATNLAAKLDEVEAAYLGELAPVTDQPLYQ